MNPHLGEEHPKYTETYPDYWMNIKRYLATLADIQSCIKEISTTLSQTVDPKMKSILRLIGRTRRHVLLRHDALLEYDKIFDQVDGLLIIQESGSLTSRQIQNLVRLEIRLDLTKREYDKHNELLKKELPCFFKLIQSAVHPMVFLVFYVQISVAYQFSLNLLSLLEVFQIDRQKLYSLDFGKKLVEDFSQPPLPLLQIVEYHKRSLNLLVSENFSEPGSTVQNFEPAFEYCKVLYSYSAQRDDELTINQGDLIKIVEATGEWWKGYLCGVVGLFPCNYVEKL